MEDYISSEGSLIRVEKIAQLHAMVTCISHESLKIGFEATTPFLYERVVLPSEKIETLWWELWELFIR